MGHNNAVVPKLGSGTRTALLAAGFVLISISASLAATEPTTNNENTARHQASSSPALAAVTPHLPSAPASRTEPSVGGLRRPVWTVGCVRSSIRWRPTSVP